MAISLDLCRTAEFCDLIFITLDSAGLMPKDLAQSFDEYERLPLLLVKKLARYDNPRLGFLEWSSNILGKAKNQEAVGFSLLRLEQWINNNTDFFNKRHLEHLDRSIGGRAHQWIYDRSMVTPAEVAELTGTHESNWRNKAAAGTIPGATKKGKQWLLPVSILRSRGKG